MATRQERASLRDGNGRAARLARWLEQKPSAPEIDHLAFEWKNDGEWVRVQLWRRDEVSPALAGPIDAAACELANELGQYLTARVVWCDPKSGAYWTEHALRVQPEDFDGEQAFDGSTANVAIQTQRALERMLSMAGGSQMQANTCLREANGQLLESNRMLGGENTRLREDLYASRERVGELEQEVARREQLLERAIEAAELAEQRGKDDTQTGQVLQLVQRALSQPPAPAG